MLVACGSFNPIHNFHLRMLELAKDRLKHKFKGYGFRGLISPVSDGYKKPGLQPFSVRSKMVNLAVETSQWIELSNKEGLKPTWTLTNDVLSEIKNDLRFVVQ